MRTVFVFFFGGGGVVTNFFFVSVWMWMTCIRVISLYSYLLTSFLKVFEKRS